VKETTKDLTKEEFCSSEKPSIENRGGDSKTGFKKKLVSYTCEGRKGRREVQQHKGMMKKIISNT